MQERRAAPRFRLSLPVDVRCVPMVKESDLLHAKMEDVSTHGPTSQTTSVWQSGRDSISLLSCPQDSLTTGTLSLMLKQEWCE